MLHIEKYSDTTCLGLRAFSPIILSIHFLLYFSISLSLIVFIPVAWKMNTFSQNILYINLHLLLGDKPFMCA